MASNFTFGLVVISEVNEILVLLAQTIILFSLYPIIFGLVRTHVKRLYDVTVVKDGHIVGTKCLD